MVHEDDIELFDTEFLEDQCVDNDSWNVLYVAIIIGIVIAIILIVLNFCYWLSAVCKFGLNVPKYLLPLTFTSILTPPLGIIYAIAAEITHEQKTSE